MTTHYVFGYGSLVNASSRARSGYTGDAIPVRVLGLCRSWNVSVPPLDTATSENGFTARESAVVGGRMTALGTVFQVGSVTNGVLVAVDDVELPKFDARERGYRRIALDPSAVSVAEGRQFARKDLLGGGCLIWVYVPRECAALNTGIPSRLHVLRRCGHDRFFGNFGVVRGRVRSRDGELGLPWS